MIHMGIKMAAKWASREYTFMFHIQMLYVRRRRRRLVPRRRRRKIARIQRRIVSKPEVKRRLLDVSERVITTTTPSDLPGSGGTSFDLALIPGGVGENQRIGNRVYITSYYGKFYVHGCATEPSNVRCIVYTPKDPDDLMTGVPYNGSVDAEKYTVWQDIFLPFSANGPNCRLLTLRKKWRYPMKTVFSGTSQDSFEQGRLGLYLISDKVNLDPEHPTITGTMKCFYKDP